MPQPPCPEKQPDRARSQPTETQHDDPDIPEGAFVVPEPEVQTVKAVVDPPLDPIEAMRRLTEAANSADVTTLRMLTSLINSRRQASRHDEPLK